MSSSVVTKVIYLTGVLFIAGGGRTRGCWRKGIPGLRFAVLNWPNRPPLKLGMAGQFSWTCAGGEKEGNGYYIVFIRPDGRFVLLKVPVGRSSFEFTPDAAGLWRWLVINTDPDRTKPDMESEPGYFQVIITLESSK